MNIRNIPRGWIYTAIRVLSLVALIFASALAVDYYISHNTFCQEGASCDTVRLSEFGKKYGIFLPTLGLLAYSFFFLASFWLEKTRLKVFGKKISTFWLPLAIICCAVGAGLFVLVQTFEIHAFCWLCMGIDSSALAMVIPAILLFMNKSDEQTPEKRPFRLHPLMWIAIYLMTAGGPLTWGTYKPSANAADHAQTEVPSYIKSFYAEGKINVVEISSFDCPHCRQLHPLLTEFLKSYGDRINFNRVSIPLGNRKESCVAYYCAQKQQKAEEYADCLFDEPSKETSKLMAHAEHCGLDQDQFKDCLVDPESSKAVDLCISNVNDSGFKGAPTVWIDETAIIGFDASKGMDPYRAAIEKSAIAQPFYEQKPVFFSTLLLLAAHLFGFGLVFTIRRQMRSKRKDETASQDGTSSQDAQQADNA